MYYRKVIKIKAENSPNVRLAFKELSEGKKPSNRILIPGLKSYADYIRDREIWDEVLQCVGLDAEWYEGAENLLFPPDWLNNSAKVAANITEKGKRRRATHIGIDPAEGGDYTCMVAIDELGLIALRSKKTPDTNQIYGAAIAFMEEYKVKPENVYFDRGGGGKQHVDRLRANGCKVNSVGFGESLIPERKRGMTPLTVRKEYDEERYIYKNRRAEMYGLLSIAIDPISKDKDAKERSKVFALPKGLLEQFSPGKKSLRHQLCKIPRVYDGEGRLMLPPKNKPNPNSKEKTLVELIGHSPDEADALVLAIYGQRGRKRRPSTVGVLI